VGPIAEADVGAGGRVRRTGREVEGRRPSGRSPEPKDQLLDAQVPYVGRLLLGGARERDEERSIQRQPDPLPGIHAEVAAEAALCSPDGRGVDADRSGKVAKRLRPSVSRGARVGAKPR
jgi:hypothetical protein